MKFHRNYSSSGTLTELAFTIANIFSVRLQNLL
jgi:hypothetical protein